MFKTGWRLWVCLVGLSGWAGMPSSSVALAQDTALSRFDADASDPLFGHYASPAERSSFWIDETYRLRFAEETAPLAWEGEAGSLSFAWKRRRRLVYRTEDYARPPRVRTSFSDAGSLAYSPMEGLDVEHDFAVFSSGMLVHRLRISNASRRTREFDVYAVYSRPTPLKKPQLKGQKDAFFFKQKAEWPGEKAQRKGGKFPEFLENMILLSQEAESWGAFSGIEEFLSKAAQVQPAGEKEPKKSKKPTTLSISTTLRIPAGESRSLGLVRSIGQSRGLMWTQGTQVLLNYTFERIFEESRQRYSRIPGHDTFADDGLYWQFWSILEQSMLKTQARGERVLHIPERTVDGRAAGQTMWDGWAMAAYAQMNCPQAMQSRRAWIADQAADGTLPRRLGPLNSSDVSAPSGTWPLMSWVNLQIQEGCPDDDFPRTSLRFGRCLGRLVVAAFRLGRRRPHRADPRRRKPRRASRPSISMRCWCGNFAPSPKWPRPWIIPASRPNGAAVPTERASESTLCSGMRSEESIGMSKSAAHRIRSTAGT